MEQWTIHKLADIATLVMGQSPPGEACNTQGIGHPLLNGPTEFDTYSPIPTQYTTAPSKFAEPGDLLFCVRGSTTGKMNWADQKYAIGRGLAAIRHKKGAVYQPLLRKIIEYNLKGILARATGSTFPNVSRQQLLDLEVAMPSEAEQEVIAKALASLDAKIELNNQQNKTLEEVAQTIFKQWFVAFDFPISDVDSAQEMLQKKLAPMLLGGGVKFPEIVELYQEIWSGGEELPESGLGEISKGGRVGKLSNIIDFDPKTPIKKGIKTRFLAMAEVPTQGFAIGELEERPYIGGAKFRLADTLLARITPCLENGKTAYVDFLNEKEIAAGSTEFIVMRGKHNVPSEFVYCLARSAEFRKYAIAQMVGTSGRQRVSTDSLKNYLFPIPKGDSLVKFGLISKPLFARISANNTQSRTLATLRDTLLPQLLSGRLTVRQAAELVG